MSFGPAIAGFALGIVFFIVAVVPQGVAAVEGVMGLVSTSLGMQPATTFGIIIALCATNDWLPLFLGVFFLHRLTRVVRQGRARPGWQQRRICDAGIGITSGTVTGPL